MSAPDGNLAQGRADLYALLSRSPNPPQFLAALRSKFTETENAVEYPAFLEFALSSRLRDPSETSLTPLDVLAAIVEHSLATRDPRSALSSIQLCKQGLSADPQLALLEGIALFCHGKQTAAKRVLRVALQIHPRHLGLLLVDAMVSAATGDPRQAMERYRTVLQHSADPPPEAFVGLALLHFAAKDTARALECVKLVLSTQNTENAVFSVELEIFQSVLSAQASSPTAPPFAAVLQKLVNVKKAEWAKSPIVVWAVATAAIHVLSPNKAVEFVSAVQQSATGEAAAFASYCIARALHAGGDTKAALEAYRRSCLASPLQQQQPHPSLSGLLQLSHALHAGLPEIDVATPLSRTSDLKTKRDYAHILLNAEDPTAAAFIHTLTKTDGAADAESWALRAIADKGDHKAAVGAATRAIALYEAQNDPQGAATSRISLHALYINENDRIASDGVLSGISENMLPEPHRAVLLHNRGVSSYLAGDYAAAAAFFERSVAAGTVPDALLGLACCAYRAMDHARCAGLVQRFTALKPRDRDGLLLCGLLGAPLPVPREHLDAETRSLLHTREGDAFFLAVLANVGLGCAPEAGVVSRALQAYFAAMQAHPRNRVAQHNAAVVLSFCGELDEAIRMLEALLAVPVDAGVRRSAMAHLADACAAAKRHAAAQKYYAKAMAAGSDSEQWYLSSRLAFSRVCASDVSGAKKALQRHSENANSQKSDDYEGSLRSHAAHGARIGEIALGAIELIDEVEANAEIPNAGRLSKIDSLQSALQELTLRPSWGAATQSRVQQAAECAALLAEVREMCSAGGAAM